VLLLPVYEVHKGWKEYLSLQRVGIHHDASSKP
jgi:hypothetical protein